MSVTGNPPAGRRESGSRAGLVALGVVVLIGAGGLFALVRYFPKRDRTAAAAPPPPTNVEALTVRPVVSLVHSFDLPGVVEPSRVVRVSAEVAAKIETYGARRFDPKAPPTTSPGRIPGPQMLDEGCQVVAGQPLVYLNTELLAVEVEHAEAQADFDQRELARITGLRERNLAARQELDQAATRAAISKAALDGARSRLQRTVIASPMTGTLNRLPTEIGEYVQPGTVVAEVVDRAAVKVVIDVPERDVRFARLGDAEQILPNHSPRFIEGKITYISELAQPQTRTTRAELTVDNRDGVLRSGQIVSVRMTRQVLENCIMIPLAAVIPTETERLVYIVRDGKAVQRRVKLGFMKDIRVLVEPYSPAGDGEPETGLKPGDQLIVSGQHFVADGQPVTIVKATTQPDGTGNGATSRQESHGSP